MVPVIKFCCYAEMLIRVVFVCSLFLHSFNVYIFILLLILSISWLAVVTLYACNIKSKSKMNFSYIFVDI